MGIENITLGEVATACAFIGSLFAIYKSASNPFKVIDTRVKDLEDKKVIYDKKFENLENDTKMMLKCMNVLLLHAQSNNNTGELKATKKELDEYLIKR